MRFPSLSLVVRAGMPRRQIGVLAAIGAASVLTACAWGDGPDRAVRRACTAAALATLIPGAGNCAPTSGAIASAETTA